MVILFDPSHWVVLTKTPLGKGPVMYFGFVGGPILIQDLVGPKIFGELQISYKDFKNKFPRKKLIFLLQLYISLSAENTVSKLKFTQKELASLRFFQKCNSCPISRQYTTDYFLLLGD